MEIMFMKQTTANILLCISIVTLKCNTALAHENLGMFFGGGTNWQNSLNLNFGIKMRELKYCPFELELGFAMPYGATIAAPIAVFKNQFLKFHFILPFLGMHLPLGQKISVKTLKEDMIYLMSGAGIELLPNQTNALKNMFFSHWTINIDWRAFIPNPVYLTKTFGDYGNKIFKQALKESELWIVIVFWH